MASSFPSSLDAFTNPSSTDAMDSVSVPHATQHADLNDAVEALEAKVGADSSAVTSSHDYKIADHASRLTTLEGRDLAGLVKISTTSIASGASSVTISNVFSSDYENYWIDGFFSLASSTVFVWFQLTGVTGGVYYGNAFYVGNGASGAINNSATSGGSSGLDIGHWRYGSAMHVSRPYTTGYTGVAMLENMDTANMRWGGGHVKSTVQSTGFVLTPNGTTFTDGQITVYGFEGT